MSSFYCPNCSNSFDIQKVISSVQGGGDISIDKIINDILNKVPISDKDIKTITTDKITSHVEYKKLTKQNKEFVLNKIKDQLNEKIKVISQNNIVPHKAFFKCTNCGYDEPIKPGMKMISKGEYGNSHKTQSYSKDFVNHSFLPRTRRYICKNLQCESHNDLSKREAIMHRINNTFQMRYVCVSCNTSWNN